jgi:hypothetical protein
MNNIFRHWYIGLIAMKGGIPDYYEENMTMVNKKN